MQAKRPSPLPRYFTCFALIGLAGVADAQEMTYREASGWIQSPNSRALGAVSSVYPDGDGNLWIAERCGQNSCEDRDALAPIHLYDPSGRWIRGFGAGLFVWPHGIYVDPDGNVWVTDGQGDGQRGSPGLQVQP